MTILDDEVARMHRDDLMREVENDRLVMHATRDRRRNGPLRISLGRILVSLGTVMVEARTAKSGSSRVVQLQGDSIAAGSLDR